MTPAQRRKNLRSLKSKKKKFSKKTKFLFLPIVFFVCLSSFYLFGKKNCFNNLNSTIVFTSKNGDVVVSSFNKKEKEINSIYIPGNTQLEVSRQLGSWKAKSIWQLGVNEKYHGKLLQETVTKNFHFPVNMWAEESASGFVSGNFLKLLKATFFPYKSNLSLGDRLNIFLVSFGVQNEKSSTIDLFDTGVLRKQRLTDGEEGFILIKDIPIYIVALFSESVGKNNLVQIINATGTRSIAENIGETIEVMGLKVTSIKEETSEDFDCFLSGKDKFFVRKLSQIYSCEVKKEQNNDFDVTIELGTGFSKRY